MKWGFFLFQTQIIGYVIVIGYIAKILTSLLFLTGNYLYS